MILGACIFVISILSSTSLLSSTTSIRKLLFTINSSPSSPEKQSKKYKNALIKILLPNSDFGLNLRNDEIIDFAVKGVEQNITVLIEPCGVQINANLHEYISSVYARLWDNMVVVGNIDLKCFVIANTNQFEKIYLNQYVDVIYSSNSTDFTNIQSIRRKHGLNSDNIAFEDCNIINKAWKSKGASLTQHIYYFDQMSSSIQIPLFNKVAMGGTFDRLHNGHRKLLTLASMSSINTLVIGLMGDDMLASKAKANLIENFTFRKNKILEFITYIINPDVLAINVVELKDPFGPTITDGEIDAIVVSSETIAGAFKINELRAEKGFKPLAVLVSRRTDAATLSSTFIRDILNNK